MTSAPLSEDQRRAQMRLKKDYEGIIREPVPQIVAHPLDDNFFEWHYVLKGPPDSHYAGGVYHGKLNFPGNFPMRPPTIRMFTPSGRFATNHRICLSLSDYHPETWNPLWTVSAVLIGLLSFMTSEEKTAGCVSANLQTRQRLAKGSWKFNLRNPVFCEMFPDLAEEAKTNEFKIK